VNSQDAAYLADSHPTLAARIEAAAREANLPQLAAVAVQFALLLGLMQVFHLEYNTVRLLLGVALVGFVVHHILPMAWRLPFFALLSLGSLALVVMPMNAMRLAGVGVVLIAICHLPIRFAYRLVLLVATAAVLVLGRAAWLPLPGYEVVWPILGSMFMFRLIVYLYDLRNGTAPFGLWRSVAYFFMLPNVCFPMYPLVDYQTLNRTYFNEPVPWRMYQLGIKWMLRGIIHLVLYRFIAQNLTVGADQVSDAAGLMRYMVTTYLLYLQISGQFHLIVGVLHMFGFNLPETHHNYLLSASFTDFWRRINIYWKDFILKIFFNPVYFRIKHWGPTAAMTVATVVAFFFTWLLHSYQWFWIRGTFPVTWQDAVFWGVLALLVLLNALYEQRYGRRRILKGKRQSFASRAGVALRTVGTFCVIVTLWCLWTFQGSFGEWLLFMGNFARINLQTAALIVAGLAGLGLAGALFGDTEREYSAGPRLKAGKNPGQPEFAFWRSAAAYTSLIMLILGAAAFSERLPLGETTGEILSELKRQRLGLQDRAERDQGYYEDLTNTRNYNLALWALYNRRPVGGDWVPISETEAGRSVPDEFQQLELVASKRIKYFGAMLSTNRWAMRDREYELKKPPGVFRAALLGTSITMGLGVGDDQTYENVLEDRLNRDHAGGAYERFELLNFAVPGFGPSQKLWTFDRALQFEPNAVIWEVHPTELERLVHHLSRIIRAGVPIPYTDLKQVLEAEELTSGVGTRAKLWQKAPDVLASIWRHVLSECERRGIALHIVLMPRVEDLRQDEASFAQLAGVAEEVGLSVIDLTKVYGPGDHSKLRIAAWDDHPNVAGHRILAAALYDALRRAPAWQAAMGGNHAGQTASHAAQPTPPDTDISQPSSKE
jgi:hypothetical protein